MSEFLAEAQVLIRPNTTSFRAELQAQIAAAAAKPIVVPVTPVVTGQSLAGVSAQATAASSAVNQLTAAQIAGASATKQAAREQLHQTQQLGQLEKAAIANTAGFLGLRGAVLTAGTAFLAGTVAIQAFSRAVGAAAQLEQNLNVFRVTVGATADEMARVREEAKLLGRDLSLPGVTASDAAQTFLALARAGLTVEEALAGAKGTLQLATAASIDFADAAQLTASALNAFGLSGESAVQVADTFANAANASQASISDMGIALRQSAAIADLAGFSFSETATFLTQLARAGLVGSDAGTSFRVAIQRLIAPTDQAREKLEQLGVNLRDVQGNLRPEAFFELADALERQGRAQADATRQLIFGNDASRAAAFLARLNASAFREQEDALTRAGTAAEIAAAKNAGFSGSLENAKNQAAALGIELGELGLPLLGTALDVIAETFGLLATQIADSRKALAGFADDAKQLQGFLKQISDDSGFTEFAQDVASGARLISGDIQRASDALDEFFGGLVGIDTSGARATSGIRELTDEEARLARQLTDSHDRVDLQVNDLERLATAAQKAAGVIARLGGQIAGLQEQASRARITGDQGTELEVLREERERLQRLLEIEENIVREGGRGAATARQRIRQEILPQLESVNSEIQNIINQQATDAKNAADDAERARDERDRNIIDAIGAEEAKRRNAVIRAQATATLKDDIKAQESLRDFYKKSIEEVRKTVKDAKLAAQTIASLVADQLRADQAVDDAEEELKRQRQERRRERRERQRESLDLDIQIAQATGNRQKEVRARQAEIEFLKEQIRQTRRNSLQRKRLILELRQAQKELRELQAEKQKTSDISKQVFFDFLQKQQGFAANLLGNLIPGFATAGLVGGQQAGLQQAVTPPSRALSEAAAVTQVQGRGLTQGQGDTQIAVLRQIRDALFQLTGRTAAPEARYQRATQSAFMDVIGT